MDMFQTGVRNRKEDSLRGEIIFRGEVILLGRELVLFRRKVLLVWCIASSSSGPDFTVHHDDVMCNNLKGCRSFLHRDSQTSKSLHLPTPLWKAPKSTKNAQSTPISTISGVKIDQISTFSKPSPNHPKSVLGAI